MLSNESTYKSSPGKECLQIFTDLVPLISNIKTLKTSQGYYVCFCN